MIGGAHLSARRREGKESSGRAHFPVVEAETEQGIGAARRPARLGEEGGSQGRSGPVRWPGPAGLISNGKKSKGF
jgi:hypothetical protein